MADILETKLPALNQAVGNFWAEIKGQGIADSVTVVQGSEFGRTISANSNSGTGHAWGGNYFMFGGGVSGGKILGEDVGVLKWVRKYMRLTSYRLRYLFRAAKLYSFASRPANLEITEPRFLTGEEQKGLCKIAVNAAANQLGINPGDT
eukprot:scaffold29242_cov20-Cyclotella_meneghiniana.AAC.1